VQTTFIFFAIVVHREGERGRGGERGGEVLLFRRRAKNGGGGANWIICPVSDAGVGI